MNTPINFTANLIKHTKIPKKNNDNDYIFQDVSIVELNKDNYKDIESLHDTTVLWNQEGAKYVSNIFHNAIKGYEYDDVECEHYFALTEQNKNFDKLAPEKILGLMLFSCESDSDEISWLQVRPNTNAVQSNNREYKNVGKAFIDLLKQINYSKEIHVISSPEAINFYKKQGFESKEDDVPSSLYLKV